MMSSPEVPITEDRNVCDICGGAMIERHCKLICVNCGYTRDCSDP